MATRLSNNEIEKKKLASVGNRPPTGYVFEYYKSDGNLYVKSSAGVEQRISSQLPFITLTDAASVVWDYSLGSNAQVTLGGNRALAQPTNVGIGDYGTLKVIQDVTGSRTLSLPATFQVVNGGASAITLTTTASAVDIICWVYDGSDFWVTFGLNFT